MTFGTKHGSIGWFYAKKQNKVETVTSPILSSEESKEGENAIKKLWALHDPNVIIYVQRNTICLCEKDQHNSLCLFKSLALKVDILAIELINKNLHLAYTTVHSSCVSIVSTANLELASTVETYMTE